MDLRGVLKTKAWLTRAIAVNVAGIMDCHLLVGSFSQGVEIALDVVSYEF